jgi:hypothetical protein
MSDETTPAIPVLVSSAYGARTQRGYVEIEIGSTKHQISPDEARTIGHMLLECAEAAQSDQFIMHLARDLDLDQHEAGMLLLRLRALREATL